MINILIYIVILDNMKNIDSFFVLLYELDDAQLDKAKPVALVFECDYFCVKKTISVKKIFGGW